MKLSWMICLLPMVAVPHVQAAVYCVKPAACGSADGSDWDNAMTLANGIVAAQKANDGSEVRIAQGVYVKSTFWDGSYTLSLTGGWRGASASDATRDVDAYETIFTQTATYPTWERLTPKFTGDKPVFEAVDTELPVIADGKVSLPPAYIGATDTYRIKTTAAVESRPFMVRGGSLTLNGLWFVGYNVGSLAHLFGGSGHAIDNCRFAGFRLSATGVNNQAGVFNTTGLSSASGCRFLYTYTTTFCSGIYIDANTQNFVLSNCTFEGCSREGVCAGGNVIYTYNPLTVTGCTFVRCQELTQNEGTRANLGSQNVNCGNIFAFNHICGGATFTDCTIRECYTASYNSYGGTPLVFGANGSGAKVRLENCTVERNLSEVRVRDGYGYPMIGRSYGGYNAYDLSQNLQLDGCVLRANTNRAVSVTEGTASYALGIVGNGINPSGSGRKTEFTLTKTVFDSNVAEAVAAEGATPVLSRGLLSVATTSGTMTHALSNLTFTGPKTNGVYDIVQYGANHTAAMKIVNSIFRVTDAVTYEPFSLTKPELMTLENTTVKNLLSSELPEGVTASTGYAYDDVLLSASYQPLVRTPDLLTVTAATGVSNRGAIQGVAQAEGTRAVVIRCDPLTDGTIEPASAVAVGDEDVTLTAVPAEGLSCTGWKDANGTLVATGPTLTVKASDLTADAVYTAVFDKAGVKLTFDLGAHAHFTGSGLSTYVTTASPGRAFPTIPEYAVDDGYVFAGWRTAVPAVAPETAVTYVAEVIAATGTRIVRFDSNNASTCLRDGGTWAGAYDDFDAALAAAFTASNAEIRIKCGEHKMASTRTLRDHLILRGGYAGSDDDDAARTDVASILNGNYSGKTCVATMFDLTSVVCDESLAFDTLTMRDCSTYVIKAGAYAHPVVTNCTFAGLVDLYYAGSARLVDCLFKEARYPQNNFELVNFTCGDTATGILERCTFDTCTVYTRAPVTVVGQRGRPTLRLFNCFFTNCTSLAYAGAAGIGRLNAFAATAPYLEVRNCRVVGNVSEGGGGAFYCSAEGIVADTLLAHNTLHRYATTGLNAGRRTTGVTDFSLVPFSASTSMRLERCTIVSNTLDCMGAAASGDGSLEATNRAALFTVTQPNALLVNNTIFGNTMTVDKAMGGEADAYSASVVLYKGKGAGALVNNTFFENVAGNGEILAKDRTSTNPMGDWNNIWSAEASCLDVRKTVRQGDKLAFPPRGLKSVSPVFRSTGTANLYVRRGAGDYVRLPDGTEIAEPSDLGLPLDDIFATTRPERRQTRGSTQMRETLGLLLLVR